MSSITSFVTPEVAGDAEIVEKKSRFIGHVVPVKSVAEAELALEDIRQRHKGANHNCYAYRVGLGIPIERFSDDGEPGGTAGRPILEVLRRRPIENVIVIVTRYFGGTLLGANGLVHAYTDATVAGLDAVSMLDCQLMQRIDVDCDYGQYGKLEYELANVGYAMLDKDFTDRVRFHVWSEVAHAEGVVEKLADWSNGQVVCTLSRPAYVGIRADGSFVFDVWHAVD
jgi:uncharacterized YigZ family protein